MGYNNYDSDYQIRIATLGALGGDTARTFDSVYDVDLAILEAIEQGGGGGGLNYNQIKELLASSGVTEIVVNGDGDSITLDYDLLSQIGQGGGGDYRCIDSVDALSGITSPKDGSLAYVADKGLWKYFAHTGITSWLPYDVYLDKLTAAEINTMCANFVSYLHYGYVPTITVQFSSTSSYITGAQYYRLQAVGLITPAIVFTSACFADSATNIFNPAYLPKIFYTTFHKVNDVWSEVSSGDTGYRTYQAMASAEYARWIGDNRAYRIVDTYDGLSAITGNYNGRIAYVKDHDEEKEVVYVYTDINSNGYDTFEILVDYGNGEEYKIREELGGRNLRMYDSSYTQDNMAFVKFDSPNIDNLEDSGNLEKLPTDFYFSNGATGTLVSSEANNNEHGYGQKNTFYFDKHNGNLPTVTFYEMEGQVYVSETSITDETVTITIPAKGWYQYNSAVSGTNKWLEYDIYINNLTPDELDNMMNRYDEHRQALFVRKLVGDQNDKVYARFEAGPVYWNQDSENPSKEVRFATSMLDDAYGSESWYMIQVAMNGDSNYKWTIRNFEHRNFVKGYQIDQVRDDLNRRVGTEWETIVNGFQSGSLFSFAPSGSATFEVWSYEITKESSAQDMAWLAQFQRRDASGRAVWTDFYNPTVRWWNEDNTGVYFEADNTWHFIGYNWNRRENVNAYGVCALKLVDNGSTMTLYMATSQEGTAASQDNEFYVDKNSEYSSGWVQEADEVISYQPHLYQMYGFESRDGSPKLKRHTLI